MAQFRAHVLCGAAVALLAGSACSFHVYGAACDDCEVVIDAPDTPPDAPPDAPPDVPPDAPPPLAKFCDPAGGNLIACYELEGTTEDGSLNDLDPSATNVTFVAGRLGMAARLNDTAIIDVAENPLLDPTSITIEAWIRPSQLPGAGLRAGIIDNQGQDGFFLHPGGDLQCIGLQVAANVPPNQWSHVACTYDGTTRLYRDGVQVGASAGGGAPLINTGVSGTSIAGDNPSGSRLIGDLDQVRIFKVARTAPQICASAGKSSCP